MGGSILTTARLVLRPLAPADAAPITRLIGDWEVARWLTQVPYPYGLSDAKDFLGRTAEKPGYWAITLGTEQAPPIGVISLRPGQGLGYWLGQAHWGQGYVPEAARAVLAAHFASADRPVLSGHHRGNARSRHVLLSLGFVDTDRITVEGAKGPEHLQRMQLTRAGWQFARDPRIETPRLILRPLMPDDAAAIAALGNDAEMARMLANVPHPFSADQARDWMGDNRWRGRPGFRWGIAAKHGTLMGMVALGGAAMKMTGGDTVPSVAYWLGRAHWGQGYATEAVAAFLADLMPRLGLDAVDADVFEENAASHTVMRKLSFRATGIALGTSAARLEPAPVVTYRLSSGGGAAR
ncbi:MAG: GNAT family N-acetyltransferase [Pseudomonadota bacterium]